MLYLYCYTLKKLCAIDMAIAIVTTLRHRSLCLLHREPKLPSPFDFVPPTLPSHTNPSLHKKNISIVCLRRCGHSLLYAIVVSCAPLQKPTASLYAIVVAYIIVRHCHRLRPLNTTTSNCCCKASLLSSLMPFS